MDQYEIVGKVVRGNPNLKGPDTKEYLTQSEYQRRVNEIIKCKNDIIYFANTYFKIISPGKGLHQIELYPKQEEMLKHMANEDRAIILASRQVGKCFSFITPVKIRHKRLKFIIVLPIGVIYILSKLKRFLLKIVVWLRILLCVNNK
jgi:hypothetical protein